MNIPVDLKHAICCLRDIIAKWMVFLVVCATVISIRRDMRDIISMRNMWAGYIWRYMYIIPGTKNMRFLLQ